MKSSARNIRGAFITVEGIEGVGKSTSLAALERCLLSLGHEVVVTREPGGTPLGERIREWLLDGEHAGLPAETEALLMFAARAYHLKTVIVPALERGQWVLCDRFTDATFAYQGGGRGLPEGFLQCLAAAVQHGLTPDLTLLLDAPVEVGRARIRERRPDHFEREQAEFFTRVRQAYLRLAEQQPHRIKRIDASLPQVQVEAALERTLQQFASVYGTS